MTNCKLLLTKLIVNNSIYLTIITSYRPPNNDYNMYINELIDILLEYFSHTTILTGDFYFNFDSDKHPHSDVIDLFNQFKFYQHNCFPKHKHGHSIDLTFTTIDSVLITAPPTNSTLITDHYAIDFIINILYKGIYTPKFIRKITSFRNLKTINFIQFSVDINDSPYSTLTSISPFHNFLTLLLKKYAPVTNKLLPTHTTTLWFSIELGTQKPLVRKKNRIYNTSPTEYNHSQLSLN